MKTTIEIPDSLYRQLKAHAALTGQSLKALFAQALREKLQREGRDEQAGWRVVFGKAPRAAIAELQRTLDAEFEQVDLDAWR